MAQEHHHGFRIWNLLESPYINEHPHIAAASVSIVAMLIAGVAYRIVAPKLTPESGQDRDFVPSTNLGVRNLFELMGEFVQGLAKDIIGHHYGQFLPLLIFVFMWTLVNNCLGLIPGLGSSTDDLNTTLGMGLFIFIYYNYQGFKSHGFKYLEHFTGHLSGALLLFLGPIMFVIELLSHMIRPVTLGIRLRSNIYGDHTIFGIFSDLFASLGQFLTLKLGVVGTILGGILSALGPVPIVILGILVCVIQAFVFMLLTTIYVGMATAHDEH